jgi:hypothetical protein
MSEAMIRWAAINPSPDASLAATRPSSNNGALSRPPVDLLKHANTF